MGAVGCGNPHLIACTALKPNYVTLPCRHANQCGRAGRPCTVFANSNYCLTRGRCQLRLPACELHAGMCGMLPCELHAGMCALKLFQERRHRGTG